MRSRQLAPGVRAILVASGRIADAIRDEGQSLIAQGPIAVLSRGILSTNQLSEIAVPKNLSKSDGGNDESVQRKGEIRSGYLRQMAIVPILVLFPGKRRVIGTPVPEREREKSQRIYPYKVWGEAMGAVVVRECGGGGAHVFRFKLRMSWG